MFKVRLCDHCNPVYTHTEEINNVRPLCELAVASLSPVHSTGAGNRRLSCPHTDSCSDDFPLSCA